MSVIKVSNIPDGTTKEQLIIHFQKRRHGGDDVDYVIYPIKPRSNTALVCFDNNDCSVEETVIEHEHIINGTRLTVEKSRPTMFTSVTAEVDCDYLPHATELPEFLRNVREDVGSEVIYNETARSCYVKGSWYQVQRVHDMLQGVAERKSQKQRTGNPRKNTDISSKTNTEGIRYANCKDYRTGAVSKHGLPSTSPPPQEFAASGSIENCPVCLAVPVNPETLAKCGHTFCRKCVKKAFQTIGRKCPVCRVLYRPLKRSQPTDGEMNIRKERSTSLPGYEGHGTIFIEYHFPGGIQTNEHPHPGKKYQGTRRTAYLPDTDKGRHVLSLLRKAFDAGLIFTIGQSATTGLDNQIIWNDVHHKTNMQGGPEQYGYPDFQYLDRIIFELEDKGVA